MAQQSVNESRPGPEVHLDEWVGPDIGDERGYLRAGKILEWMDVVGVLAATRHCRKPVVTASVDGMELRVPVRVGERVALKAALAFTSDRSMGIAVSMFHGSPSGDQVRKSLEAYMTFVSLGADGKPQRVPQFSPETPEQQARFREGSLRREFRQQLAEGSLPFATASDRTFSSTTGRERALLVREMLKILPKTFHLPWERPEPQKPRGRTDSYVHKIEPVQMSDLNFHGTLYGGKLMRWIETTAQLSARAYLEGAPVRLSGLHGLTFIRPVQRHVFVHIHSVVVHADEATLTVLVNVKSEDPVHGQYVETLRAFLTFMPETGAGRIPPLECHGADEGVIFREVEHRRELQRVLYSDELNR